MQLGLLLSGKGITSDVPSLGLPNTMTKKPSQPAQCMSRIRCIQIRGPLTIQ